MKAIPLSALVGALRPGIARLRQMKIPLLAAYSGFFIVLSLFPALLLVLSGLSRTGLTAHRLLELLEGVLPRALMGAAEQLISSVYRNASGAVAGFSALTALWSASRGVYGLVTGLNAVYGVAERRGYLLTRLISVAYTFVLEAVLALTLALYVFGTGLLNFLRSLGLPAATVLAGLLDMRYVLLPAVQSLLFTLMFMLLPNRRSSLRESLPGGLLAGAGWLLFSRLYFLYVSHFPRYANIYGSVYAIAVSMLWLYGCLEIIFLGGALNRLLGDFRKNNL